MSGLAGRRIVVTRPRSQARGLVERLEAAGARVVEVPTIGIVDPPDGGAALREAAAGSYDWVAFTSANAVGRFCDSLAGGALPAGVRVAAVGPGTAGALAARGLGADLVARRSVAEGLVEDFPAGPGSVLVPQAEAARDALAEGLRAKGWAVTTVVAYRTVEVAVGPEVAAAAARADAVAFTSASTVRSFLDGAGPAALPPVVVCIGPRTAAAAADRGVTVTAVAQHHTLDGLVAALASALG